MTVQTISVSEDDAGERLDAVAARRAAGLSRARIQNLIGVGRVLLNGVAARKGAHVKAGDAISIRTDALAGEQHALPGAEDIPLSVIFEDEHVLAVNKPPGLVVHPGNARRSGTLVNALVHYTAKLSGGFAPERPGIVHRLDKDTSGVVLVAKSDTVHAALAAQFMDRTVEKYYLGVTVGYVTRQEGTIDAAIGRSVREPTKRAVRQGGKPARTGYRVLGHHCGISLVRFRLHTGRTHQIRVHCAYAGMPILGDVDYGGGKGRVLSLQPLDRPFAHKVYHCFGRSALHAHSITFSHPATGARVTCRAPLPEDFRAAIALLSTQIEVASADEGGE